MKYRKPRLNASLATVKIEPWLEIKGLRKSITISETSPKLLVRFCLTSKEGIRFVDIDTFEDFDKLWNKLMEISIPCH
jgi:hypothetical protein